MQEGFENNNPEKIFDKPLECGTKTFNYLSEGFNMSMKEKEVVQRKKTEIQTSTKFHLTMGSRDWISISSLLCI
jgi:hypothetical protein